MNSAGKDKWDSAATMYLKSKVERKRDVYIKIVKVVGQLCVCDLFIFSCEGNLKVTIRDFWQGIWGMEGT